MTEGRLPARGVGAPAKAVVALLVLVAVILVAALALRLAGTQPKPAQAAAAPSPAPAGTFRPTSDQWRNLTFADVHDFAFPAQEATDGQIATDDDVTVQVMPPFSGQVTQVLVKAGDHVAKGQALALANASEFAQAQSDLATAAANLTAARAALEAAQINAGRQQALFKINGNAARDVQQSQADLATAIGNVKADEAAGTAVRNRLLVLGYDSAQIAALQSRSSVGVTSAQAAVRSPIAGVVTQRQVGPGQYLNSTANGATTSLLTVSDLSKVWLTAEVREENAGQMHVGDPMQVTVMALPGRVFAARLSYVSPVIDPTTRRLQVRATVANPGDELKPQMLAQFVITSGAGERAPAVPEQAVIYEGDTARVWIARPDHTLALRYFKAGRTRAGLVEALDGLHAGDRVVVSGALFIDRASQTS